MKTIGRILIILAAFSVLAGLMVLAVNASGGSSSAPGFDGAPPQFEGKEGRGGFRPEGGETRPEFGERGERGGGWMFGLTKNLVVISLLVTLIVLPKSIAKNKRKQAAVNPVKNGVS